MFDGQALINLAEPDLAKITEHDKPRQFAIALSNRHRAMLGYIAAKKYRVPENLAHAFRLMIEDTYKDITGIKESGHGRVR